MVEKDSQQKKKTLKSERPKRRYLAFEVISNAKFDSNDIFKALMARAYEYIGKFGVKNANIKFIAEKWNSEMQRGIIRVNNNYLNDLKDLLPLIKNINSNDIMIKSIGVSGILNRAEKKYMGERK